MTGQKLRVAILALTTILAVRWMNINRLEAYQTAPQQARPTDALIYSVKGPDLFRAYCASCHGINGAGNGPAAPALRKQVPNLTLIARRNGGIFPEDRIRHIIAGDTTIAAHGSRQMPVWGPIFHQVEQDQDWGNVRLQNLTRYLESIQKKQTPNK